ncbi:MAG: 6-oxocyclohex-1-ene-1-carbonyl-CoA hydratase [Planctomycetota bacterium]|jgi:6-oxo-cyclohex-1-ene-carbonyl-CoA hydrolase
MLKNHDIVEMKEFPGIRYELRQAKTPDGTPAEGIHNAWIWLDNPKQFNSYTTEMVKSVIMGFRTASNDRSVNAIVFTAVGDKAFCTGGNTKEYAEYYAGNPQEYQQYMRLFNDMVTNILIAEKPVICRVNGMRIAGGQEIGMATDFTVSQDLARFGQAGPKHGSAPVGGSTDFLQLFVGIERAMWSGTLCETWTAYQAKHLGLIHDVVPALKVDGKYIPNPMVITDRYLDDMGRVVYGMPKSGDELKKGKELLKKGEVDLSLLDETVDRLAGQLLMTFPNCTMMTIQQLRKFKMESWYRNSESNRQWLGQNMMTEAKAGFRAFNEGTKETGREIDFIRLRQLLAEGRGWDDELIREISPQYKK